jgi:hypothetical protein
VIYQLLLEALNKAVIDVNKASQNISAAPARGGETNGGQSVHTHSDGKIVEISHITNVAVVNTTSEMPTNRESLSELSLPSFVDCNKQSVVTFLQDPDMYFELKKVQEKLKLPLVLRAIKDPFAQNWVSSEYHKIDSYPSFKVQFSKLFSNEHENCVISHSE